MVDPEPYLRALKWTLILTLGAIALLIIGGIIATVIH